MFEKYIHQDIEQWILGDFLNNNDHIGISSNLLSKHFLYEKHSSIYKKMLKCWESGLPFLPSKLGIEKEEDKKYISDLMNSSMTVVDVKPLIETLITDSEKYLALQELNKLVNLANEEPDIDVFGTMSGLAIQNNSGKIPTTVEQMMTELYNRMDGKDTGIKTGIDGLDEYMNGFQKGRLYIIGARSGMGKSALMCSIVEKIESNVKTGIVSLEMLDKELKQRIACIRGKIPHWKIEKGRCSDEEASQYGDCLMTIKNLYIDDTGGMSRGMVISTIRQMVKKNKCDIIFIDHIGLIRVNGNQNLAHEIGENTSALKALAKELNIPIVGLCQINRAAESNGEKMPTLSQLRDSGRIEEDADCVILLYRQSYYMQEEQPVETCQYKIAKCRNGKRGIVDGTFTGELMKFE